MGDSRSWGAEKEDEVTICRHGAESSYFDTCQCPGCREDRDNADRLADRQRNIRKILDKVLTEQPETKYDLIEEYLSLMTNERLIRDSKTGKLKQ